MRALFVLPVLLAAVTVSSPARAATWEIDTNHSTVGFVAKHLVFAKVRGMFKEWKGTVVLDDKDITKSKVEVTIKTASVDTGTPDRDKHLRSADFFDAEKMPEMTFKSTKVEQKEPGTLLVTGDLTLRGVTKPVVLEVTGPSAEFKDPGGRPHVAFSATTKIKRQDFGLMWNKAVEAGPVVGDIIAIEIEVELKNKQP